MKALHAASVVVAVCLLGCPSRTGLTPAPVHVPTMLEPVASDECSAFLLVVPQPSSWYAKQLPRARNVVARCEDEAICRAELDGDRVVVRGLAAGTTNVRVSFDNPTTGGHEEGSVRVTFTTPPRPDALHPRIVGANRCPAVAKAVVQTDIAEAAARSDAVFVGRLVEVGRAPHFWSGLVPAMQSLTFEVERVIAGSLTASKVTVDCLIVGGGDGRVVGRDAAVTAEYARVGERYIVPTRTVPELARPMLVIEGYEHATPSTISSVEAKVKAL